MLKIYLVRLAENTLTIYGKKQMPKKITLREGYEPRIGACRICGGKLKAKGLCHSHFASERRRINVAAMKLANESPVEEYWQWVKSELNLK